MPLNDIKRSPLPGLQRPTPNRPSVPTQATTPQQGARTRSTNSASDALRSRTPSRATSASSSRSDMARNIASNVLNLIDSGALPLREGGTQAALTRALLIAARGALEFSRPTLQRST